MLLEPTPIDPRPGRVRARAAAAAIVVVGVLVAVVALGIADPSRPSDAEALATPADAETSSTAPVDAAAPPASTSPVAALPTSAPRSTDGRAGPPLWSRFGLDPSSVVAVLDDHWNGTDDGRSIAVLGWLSVRPGRTDCRAAATSSAVACTREGILSAEPAPTLAWRGARVIDIDVTVPHLRPIFPPDFGSDGPALPSPPPAGDGMAIAPHPVVLVGRFESVGTEVCRNGFLGCSDPFVVERMIPITGEGIDQSVDQSGSGAS